MSGPDIIASAEDRLIARYFAPIARHPGAFGLGDDAAVIEPPHGCDLVLKTDGIVAGVHFFPEDPPDTVARKALRVNLSDLAAKGARPLGFLLTLALPNDIDDAWLTPFAGGLGDDAERFGCPLLGGDTDRTPGPITISIAAFGAVPRGRMVRRAGARSGDRLIATGTIGDAALGLLLRRGPHRARRWRLTDREREHLIGRYLLPQPRTALAELLLAQASAAMDVSDGLAGDLGKLCRASNVSAEVEVARLPLSPAVRTALASKPALIEAILSGGDDYEILAAIPAGQIEMFLQQAGAAGIAAAEVGTILAGADEPRFVDANGKPLALARRSFSHF